jgi:hypothetical protein
MGRVVKRSLSFPPELFAEFEAEAAAEGIGVSTAMSLAAEQWLLTRRGLRAVAEWEAEHGALSAAELAAADRLLDEAGVGTGSSADVQGRSAGK